MQLYFAHKQQLLNESSFYIACWFSFMVFSCNWMFCKKRRIHMFDFFFYHIGIDQIQTIPNPTLEVWRWIGGFVPYCRCLWGWWLSRPPAGSCPASTPCLWRPADAAFWRRPRWSASPPYGPSQTWSDAAGDKSQVTCTSIVLHCFKAGRKTHRASHSFALLLALKDN